MSNLTGKVAVVTGAAGILCSEFAKELAKNGASVALLDLNLEAAQKVADEINKYGKAIAVKANVLERASLEEARESVRSNLGTCDILVNGAGGNHPKGSTTNEFYNLGDEDSDLVSFFDLDQGGIDFVMNLNFMGTLLPTQIFALDMVNKEDASIINISSMNAYTPLTKIPAYSAAKASVSNLTQWLAVHFSKTNIRVNGIAPGFFETNQNRALLRDESGEYSLRAQKILRNTPMGRFGQAEELLGTLMFLVDKSVSGFITGIVIPVDGGFSSYSGV